MTNTKVCNICGSTVADTDRHTSFHKNLVFLICSPMGEEMAVKQSESVVKNISFTDGSAPAQKTTARKGPGKPMPLSQLKTRMAEHYPAPAEQPESYPGEAEDNAKAWKKMVSRSPWLAAEFDD